MHAARVTMHGARVTTHAAKVTPHGREVTPQAGERMIWMRGGGMSGGVQGAAGEGFGCMGPKRWPREHQY